MTLVQRAATMVVFGVLAGVRTLPAYAAAPPIILVTGPPLAQTVALTTWDLNVELMGSGADHPIGQLEPPAGRPFLDLALFTGSP